MPKNTTRTGTRFFWGLLFSIVNLLFAMGCINTAHAGTVRAITVGGTTYNVAFSDSVAIASCSAAIQASPWWGNPALAYDLAAALGGQLGYPTGGGVYGPLFAFQTYSGGTDNSAARNDGVIATSSGNGWPTASVAQWAVAQNQLGLSPSCTTASSPPFLGSVSPNAGLPAGGAVVTLTGAGFTGATAVTIGGVAATGITVNSDSSITATTPAHALGVVSVLVTTPDGTNTANTLFTYSATPTYSVTYSGNSNSNSGGVAPTDTTAYSGGATVTVPVNGSLVRTGYTFAGWNTAANGSGTDYAAGAGTFTINADTTLYAKWTINQYTVTFNANTGSGTMAGQTANYNAATALTANAFTKTGYTFAGWNTLAGGGGTSYANSASYPFTSSTTLYAQWTLATTPPVTTPSNPIPGAVTPPTTPGIGSNPLSPLNLASGTGPAMVNCLRDTLLSVIGANAVYLGQTADGAARIGQTGRLVSFYALEATTGNGQNLGINLRNTNALNVVTTCGTFLTVPAVYNLTAWGAFLNGLGLSAQFSSQGVMKVPVAGATYVARPDYLVTQGNPGAPNLATGGDGLMRFTDSAGNVQILYPAFLDAEVLGNQVAQAVSGSTLIQTDGTALVTLMNGQQFVLTPDMTLGDVPPQYVSLGWWQDGPNHYRYRNAGLSPTSQGFTVRPR